METHFSITFLLGEGHKVQSCVIPRRARGLGLWRA